ncbi:MAG: exonuclease SbcCD subunit D [Polyangiales bacterium]
MRIAHLADLHLGRVFHGTSLLDDQRHALERVVELLRAERADVLVLAGDLYDRALPGAEAVRLFDAFLREVVEGARVPVVAIAGNHDSADHLGFGSWLFSRGDVHVRGRLEPDALPITLEDEHGEVTFYPLPYVEPEAARPLLGDAPEEALSHRAVVRAMADAARRHRAASGVRRAVLVAHGFVRGDEAPAESRRSERSLYLGGVGAVPASDLEGFDYVALGHLHRPQSVTRDDRVRYSGSLLKYSFDEVSHAKGVTLVELGPRGERAVRHAPITPRRDLATARGTLRELLDDPALEALRGSFLSVELTEHPPPLQAMERLRQRFPHAVELHFQRPDAPGAPPVGEVPPPARDPEEVFAEFYARYEGAPSDEAREVFRRALLAARGRQEGRP